MKELHKRLLALGMGAVMIFAMGAAGCNSGNQGQTPSSGTTTPDPDKDKEPDDSPLPEMRTLEDAKTEFDAFVDRLATGKNFTYVLKSASQNVTTQFAGNKAKSDRNGEVYYLTEENGENFVFELENDNAWHKDFAEDNMTIDHAISTVTDALADVTWTAYDSNTNLLSGDVSTTIDGTPIIAKVEANFDQDDMSVKMKSGLTTTNMSVSKIGTTTVTLPANVIDETAQNNNIFTVENGEYVWNVKAIKDVLEPWLKNEMTDAQGKHIDNQFGEDVFARRRLNSEYKTREVLYINVTDQITFGMIFDVGDTIRFGEASLISDDLKTKINNHELKTKSDLTSYLATVKVKEIQSAAPDFDVEYTTHDQDYEKEHKQEFETLTKNVFEKYHKEKAANDPDYNGAKVLFAFKTEPSSQTLGDGRYGRQWSQYYLIEKNNDLSLIKISPRGLITGLGYYENVLQNEDGFWSLENNGKVMEIAKVSNDNLCLYSSSIMTIGKQTNLSKE